MKTLITVTGSVLACLLTSCGTSTETANQGLAPIESPLSQYLGLGYHVTETETQLSSDEYERQLFIQECMSAAGFTYAPLAGDTAIFEDEDGVLRTVGGKSDEAEAQRANEKYVGSLSPDQREAYWMALIDRRTNDEGITEAELRRLDPNGDGKISYEESFDHGCSGAASEAVPSVYEAARQLDVAYDRLENRVRAIGQDSARALSVCMIGTISTEGVSTEEMAEFAAGIAAADRPESSGAAACLDTYNTTQESTVIAVETKFFREHESVIEEYGVPYEA